MTDSNVVDLQLFAREIEEIDWYYGAADAALGMKGIDYRSEGSATQVEDEARHVRRILAPMDPGWTEDHAPKHRMGLWKRAWVEAVLAGMWAHQVRVLETAFTARRWSGLTTLKCGAGLPLPEMALRRLLSIRIPEGRAADRRRMGNAEPVRAATLIELALDYLASLEADPLDIGSPVDREALLRELLDLARDTQLAWIKATQREAARYKLAQLRQRVGAILTPALRAYRDARELVDPDRHPSAILHKEHVRRVEEKRKAREAHGMSERAAARRAALQGLGGGLRWST